MGRREKHTLLWVGAASAAFLGASVWMIGVPFDLAQTTALVILLICAGGLVYHRLGGADARVARDVIRQFLVSIALPVLALLGLPLLGLSLVFEIDTRLWQAIIAGLVIAIGWLTTAVFGTLEQKRARAEKLRDYHKALYAEIGNTLQILWDRGKAEGEAAAIVSRMEQDEGFIPLIPREHHDFVYDSLVDEIEVLPRVTIDAIVAYYSLVKSIAAQAEDLRGDVFRGSDLSQDRRIVMYKDYFETRKSAFALGQHALRLIKEYSEHGAEAAGRLAQRLNTPDAGPSGRSQGSE